MAKIRLSEGGFSLIPEGTTTFKIVEVDDSKYEDFGKLEVKLQTKSGATHVERFTLIKDDGNINEGALKAWSYFAKTCLNNYSLDEIDTQDIVGCYITATVKHEEYDYTNKKGERKTGKSAKLNDYAVAIGFGSDSNSQSEPDEDGFQNIPDEIDDLDNFLDE